VLVDDAIRGAQRTLWQAASPPSRPPQSA